MSATLAAPAAERTATPMVLRLFAYHWLVYKRSWRGSIVIGLANPLLFLTGIGVGIGKLIDSAPGGPPGGVPYLSFLAPGVLAASAMQMGFGAGGFQVFMSATPTGSFSATVATPASPTQILLGHQLFTAFRILLLSSGFFLVQALLGAAESWESVLTVPAAALMGVAIAAPTAAWSISQRRFSTVRTVFRFVIQPLYLLSGTFFPLSTVPGWLQKLAYASPLWHGVELCRDLNLGTLTAGGLAVHGGFLVACVALGLLLARRAFQRRLHQ